MDYKLNRDQELLREIARDFTNKEIKPIAHQIDENESIPPNLIKKIGEMGFLGTAYPEEYGGAGLGEVGFCILQEEITRGCSSTAAFIGAHQSIGANAILVGGSEDLKRRYLPQLTSGEKLAAFCLTEPDAGSDTFHLKTVARKHSDKWILNGSKAWITNAGIADVFSVFARTDKGISGFVVEKGFPGVSVGKNEKKLGIKGSVTNSVTLEDVEVPDENMIGTDGKGFLIAMSTLNVGRLGLGACCLGASKELLEISTKYSKQRKQFGEAIAKFQAIQFMLAEMSASIYLMDSIIYRTAYNYDNKRDISHEAAIVKLFCSEAVGEIADKALQIHGGMGFSRELPLERFYRDARVLKIFEGTNEIQKLIIGRYVVKNNGKWILE